MELKEIVIPKRVPLLKAPFWNYTEAVSVKLEPLIKANFGQEAMNLAVIDNQPELIELFVKLGIKVSAKNIQNVQTGDQKTLYKLIELSDNINDLGFSLNNIDIRGGHCNSFSYTKLNSDVVQCNEQFINKLFENGYPDNDYLILKWAEQGLTGSLNDIVKRGANISIIYPTMDPSCDSAITCAYKYQKMGSIAKISELSKAGVQTEWIRAIQFPLQFPLPPNKCNLDELYKLPQYEENRQGWYDRLLNKCKNQIDCQKEYVTLFAQGKLPNESCANGMAEFLYIIKELQTAYSENMKSSTHVQTDGTIDSHSEDTSLLGCHE